MQKTFFGLAALFAVPENFIAARTDDNYDVESRTWVDGYNLD
jgi:hypothetical protein